MGGFLSKHVPCLRGEATNKTPRRLSPKLRPRLTEDEIMQQLRDEGIVPSRRATGGVAFSVGPHRLYIAAPPRRLSRLSTPRQYTSYERELMADLTRYDKLVDDVQRKTIDRETKHLLAKKKRSFQDDVHRSMAEHKLREREARLRKLEEEREMKKKEMETKKKMKREELLKRKAESGKKSPCL